MDSLSYTVNLKNDVTWMMNRLHFHDSLEFYFAVSDGGECYIEDKIHRIEKNTLFIFRPSVLHRTVWDTKGEAFIRYTLQIKPETLSAISTSKTNFTAILEGAGDCIHFNEEDGKEVIALFHQLGKTPADGFGEDIARNIIFLQLILRLFQKFENYHWDTGVTNPYYKNVTPILDYINEHFTEQINLEQLAANFSFSKYYLCHIFKDVTGFSIMDYVIQQRILYAQELLRKDHSVQAAGEKSGFQTNSHFIRTFNTYIGTSPKRYAKQYATGDNYQYFKGDKT